MRTRTHITQVSAMCYMDMFFGWINSEELEYSVVCDKLLGGGYEIHPKKLLNPCL